MLIAFIVYAANKSSIRVSKCLSLINEAVCTDNNIEIESLKEH